MKSFRFSIAALLVALISAHISTAQLPQPVNISTPVSPEVEQARALARKFIEAAFSGDYRSAEKMMNPNPPQKGKKSTSEFAKSRQDSIKQIVDKRDELGKSREWDKTIDGEFRTWSERPPEEQFADFTFWCTYPNGVKSSNRVTVIKKGGSMYIERFMY